MALGELLRAVRERAPWNAAGRPMMKSAGYEIVRGADATIAMALGAASDPVRESRLEWHLREHALAGEKLVRVVSLQPGERDSLRRWIVGKRRTSGPLSDAFPGIAQEQDVQGAYLQTPASVGHADVEVGDAAMYTAVRTYRKRIQLNLNALQAGVNQGYEEVFATKRVYWQSLDSIWLAPGHDFAFLIADLPEKVPSGFASESQAFLLQQLRQQLGRAISPVNLWSAVEGLYLDPAGRLVDHGFVNNAEAVKLHTARRGGRSLRTDPYDQAGAAAVGQDLLTYRVAVAWDRTGSQASSNAPEVSLPGSARSLATSSLTHMVVRNCLGSRDLAAVVSKVLSHI